jgi:hypothetical protein
VGGGDVSGRYRKRAAVTGGRYRKRPLQAAVTGSGRYRRPLQEAGGGDVSGRYINNALRQDASTTIPGQSRGGDSKLLCLEVSYSQESPPPSFCHPHPTASHAGAHQHLRSRGGVVWLHAAQHHHHCCLFCSLLYLLVWLWCKVLDCSCRNGCCAICSIIGYRTLTLAPALKLPLLAYGPGL